MRRQITLELLLNLAEFLEAHPDYCDSLGRYVGKQLDRSTLLEDVQPALDFVRDNGKAVYCGEYGVIDGAPMQTRINWTSDFVSILRRKQDRTSILVL